MQRAIATILELCAIPAPSGHERARAEMVHSRLKACGLKPKYDAVGNVVALVGPERPVTVFAAHLDTVFALETPLRPHRVGDVLYGPGVGDNCTGLAALLHLAETLSHEPLGGGLLLAATVGEEGAGNLRGARHLVKTWACHAFVAVEGHGVAQIRTAATWTLRYHVCYVGSGGHPWRDRSTASAIERLVERTAELMPQIHPAVRLNIGLISGGEAVNRIAREARLDLELRTTDAEALGEASRAVQAFMQHTGRPDLVAKVEVVDRRPGGQTDRASPLVVAAHEARRLVGLPQASDEASSTDANAAIGCGVPGITVGISNGGRSHSTDEWISVEPLPKTLKALELLARKQCLPPDGPRGHEPT